MTFIDKCGQPWKLCAWTEEFPNHPKDQDGEALWIFYWSSYQKWAVLRQATDKTEAVMLAEMQRMPPFTESLYETLNLLHK